MHSINQCSRLSVVTIALQNQSADQVCQSVGKPELTPLLSFHLGRQNQKLDSKAWEIRLHRLARPKRYQQVAHFYWDFFPCPAVGTAGRCGHAHALRLTRSTTISCAAEQISECVLKSRTAHPKSHSPRAKHFCEKESSSPSKVFWSLVPMAIPARLAAATGDLKIKIPMRAPATPIPRAPKTVAVAMSHPTGNWKNGSRTVSIRNHASQLEPLDGMTKPIRASRAAFQNAKMKEGNTGSAIKDTAAARENSNAKLPTTT